MDPLKSGQITGQPSLNPFEKQPAGKPESVQSPDSAELSSDVKRMLHTFGLPEPKPTPEEMMRNAQQIGKQTDVVDKRSLPTKEAPGEVPIPKPASLPQTFPTPDFGDKTSAQPPTATVQASPDGSVRTGSVTPQNVTPSPSPSPAPDAANPQTQGLEQTMAQYEQVKQKQQMEQLQLEMYLSGLEHQKTLQNMIRNFIKKMNELEQQQRMYEMQANFSIGVNWAKALGGN